MEYNKPSLPIDQQLALMESRGLTIVNKDKATHYLQFIGYYRLSGYSYSFQNHKELDKPFYPGTTFDNILNLYIFDRRLRLLVMDAIERIEVAVKAVISNTLSYKYNPHWYMDANIFNPRYDHSRFIHQVKEETGYNNQSKVSHQFCRHYYQKYNTPSLPPSWMTAEVLPLGTFSILYNNLKRRDDQKAISRQFNLADTVFSSWLHALAFLRNTCAHHLRLWNRTFTIKPIIANSYSRYLTPNDKFYAQACVINVLLSIIAKGTHWQQRLYELISDNPGIPYKNMGFPDKWQEDTFWNISAK